MFAKQPLTLKNKGKIVAPARLLIVLLTCCCIVTTSSTPAQSPIIALESKVDNNTTAQQTLTQLIHSAPFAIVKFFLPGCGPCATMKTRFTTLAQEFHDRITFIDVNFKLFGALAQQYAVQSVPTLIYFVNGVEKGRLIGAKTPADLRTKIREHFFKF